MHANCEYVLQGVPVNSVHLLMDGAAARRCAVVAVLLRQAEEGRATRGVEQAWFRVQLCQSCHRYLLSKYEISVDIFIVPQIKQPSRKLLRCRSKLKCSMRPRLYDACMRAAASERTSTATR